MSTNGALFTCLLIGAHLLRLIQQKQKAPPAEAVQGELRHKASRRPLQRHEGVVDGRHDVEDHAVRVKVAFVVGQPSLQHVGRP